MDVFLNFAGTLLAQARARTTTRCRATTTADGYIPEPSRNDTRAIRRNSRVVLQEHLRTAEDGTDSVGTVLTKIGVQMMSMALVSYVSARMIQFTLKGNDRPVKQAARALLKAKLPDRTDIDIDKLDLNSHEMTVASDVVASSELVTTFDMIGGLDEMKEEIMDIVTLACSREAQLQRVPAPRGILLSGVPGTGKTMLAQAIAKESGATFINVRMGAVTQKYVGEGEKIVAALFSLAHKLAPSIIFIDEIDCFLRNRTGFEREHDLRVKTEFMTLWDGLLTVRSSPVMVLGTTNRPSDVDPAILRRLPRQFIVGLPETPEQRLQILRLMTRKYQLSADVDLRLIAVATDRFSGSDLEALCQAAQTIPAREFAQALREAQADGRDVRARRLVAPLRQSSSSQHGPSGRGASPTAAAAPPASAVPAGGDAERSSVRMRRIRMADFETALGQVRPTGDVAALFTAANVTDNRTQQ